MARAQLSTGSYNKNDTLYAQQLLNDYGYGLAVDGIYGPKTAAAVKSFQKKNGLAVDGILGKNTWAALTAKEETYEAKDPRDYLYDGTKNEQYQTLLQQAKDAEAALSNPLDVYRERLESLSKEGFSYDAEKDPLYRQYVDRYTRQGALAMLDTMGTAASLTGGYGSSYGTALGQQSYQSYLQKLSDAMPALYESAYQRNAEQYDQLLQQAKLDYDDYENQQKAVQELYDRANDAYKQGYDNWYDAYKNQTSDKKTLYNSIVNLITKTGYIPSSAQLKAAGMTEAEAAAYLSAYRR